MIGSSSTAKIRIFISLRYRWAFRPSFPRAANGDLPASPFRARLWPIGGNLVIRRKCCSTWAGMGNIDSNVEGNAQLAPRFGAFWANSAESPEHAKAIRLSRRKKIRPPTQFSTTPAPEWPRSRCRPTFSASHRTQECDGPKATDASFRLSPPWITVHVLATITPLLIY